MHEIVEGVNKLIKLVENITNTNEHIIYLLFVMYYCNNIQIMVINKIYVEMRDGNEVSMPNEPDMIKPAF